MPGTSGSSTTPSWIVRGRLALPGHSGLCVLCDMAPEHLADLLQLGGRRPLWLRVLGLAGAVIFFVLGVVGWLIPVITGLPFYAVALVLLALSSDRVGSWVNRTERRLPRPTRLAIRRVLARITTPRIRRVLRLVEIEPPAA